MRAFIILILLAAAGYYLYSRHGASAAQPSGDELPAEIAWRMVSRDQRGAVTFVAIVAVNGNRWRCEGGDPNQRNTPFVTVSDGSAAAASNPKVSATSLDPRPPMRLILRGIRHASPTATEQIAGLPYLHFAQTLNGNSYHVWAEPKTRFPFQVRGPGYFDIYTVLPALSERNIPNLFSIHSLTPLLSRYATTQ